jgi:hypothetical protein
MKDIIIVGAYCPDEERIELLDNLINQLQKIRNDFDIMIATHSILPEYFYKKIDFVFYDRNNHIIHDVSLIDRSWFRPGGEASKEIIHSNLCGGENNYTLAVFRLLIGALGLSNTMKYEKAHWIEYDTSLKDFSELYENSKLLNKYDAVGYYKGKSKWADPTVLTINIKKLDDDLLIYNEKKILDELKNSWEKHFEGALYKILNKNEKLFLRDISLLTNGGNEYGLSGNIESNLKYLWAAPFWDNRANKVNYICWNNKSLKTLNINIIINNLKIINIGELTSSKWSIITIGDFEEIDSIVLMANNKILKKTDLSKMKFDSFAANNFMEYRE